jgi:hypothetical protein
MRSAQELALRGDRLGPGGGQEQVAERAPGAGGGLARGEGLGQR